MGVTLIAKKMRIILIKMEKFNRKGELLKNRIKYWSDNCTFMKCCYYNACLSFFKFNLSYSDILDLSQSPHGSCIGWRTVICCSFGSLLQLSVAWLLHPCWIVHCVCKYLLYCIMIHCAKGYCTGWHWIIHCLLWQSGAEGGNACERYEQKTARRHCWGLYVPLHHPGKECVFSTFQQRTIVASVTLVWQCTFSGNWIITS